MTTLRNLLVSIDFDQSGNIADATFKRYLDVDGYRQTSTHNAAHLADQTRHRLAIVVSAIQARRAVDERAVEVFGELLAPVADTFTTTTTTDQETGAEIVTPTPATFRNRVSLAVTLRKLPPAQGERQLVVDSETLTAPQRAALLALWDDLAALP